MRMEEKYLCKYILIIDLAQFLSSMCMNYIGLCLYVLATSIVTCHYSFYMTWYIYAVLPIATVISTYCKIISQPIFLLI